MVTRITHHVGVTASAGGAIGAAGLVLWALTIGLQPTLTAAGFEAMARADLPLEFNSETHRVLLLDAHDLRLAALIVVAAGASLVVAGVPRSAARPGPPLAAVAGVVLVANLGWGLLDVDVPAMIASTAVAATVAARAAVTRWPATGSELRTNRSLRLVPALFAVGAGFALTAQSAQHPALRPFVPSAYFDVVTGVRLLLVLAAVAGALAVGGRWLAPRLVVGCVVGLLAGGAVVLGDDGWAAPVAGALGAAVLVLAWSGERGGHRGKQVLGAAVAVAVPVFGGLALLYAGLVVGVVSLVLTGAAIGADGMPMIGSGLLFGAALLAVDGANTTPERRP